MYIPANSGERIGPDPLAALVAGWRPDGRGSLARGLAHTLRSRIASGLIGPGSVLPPERSLAASLGVSRSTVVAAFDELRADGYIDSRQGSGTWVAVVDGAGPDGVTAAQRLLLGASNINLAASVPSDASHLPRVALDVADLASVTPAHGYAPAGLPSLRQAIAARTSRLGLATTPEQVHVTNGAQHALDLALAAATRSGDLVVVEDPTYVGVFDLLDARSLRALPVPVDTVDRAPDELVRLARARRAKAVLLVPAVHSPTGRVRSRTQLHRLAARLDELDVTVIEDNTVADLVFAGGRPPSLASLCRRAQVISVESTSKVAWGGLRIGWLRGGAEVIEQSIVLRGRTDFGSSVPAQLIAQRLLVDYDELVSERRIALGVAADRFLDLLGQQLPEWRTERPRGGLSLWVEVGVDADELAAHALRHGVTVAPGGSASRSAEARTRLRLCYDRPLVELVAAVPRLRRAWEDARGWR